MRKRPEYRRNRCHPSQLISVPGFRILGSLKKLSPVGDWPPDLKQLNELPNFLKPGTASADSQTPLSSKTSNCVNVRSNTAIAASIGSGFDRSTPASRSMSSGGLEQPPLSIVR